MCPLILFFYKNVTHLYKLIYLLGFWWLFDTMFFIIFLFLQFIFFIKKKKRIIQPPRKLLGTIPVMILRNILAHFSPYKIPWTPQTTLLASFWTTEEQSINSLPVCSSSRHGFRELEGIFQGEKIYWCCSCTLIHSDFVYFSLQKL